MTVHIGILNWGLGDQYWNGWEIGSTDDDGAHMRGVEGWPYSIYRKAKQIGVTDAVLAHGIQCMDDATALCAMLNKDWVARHAP